MRGILAAIIGLAFLATFSSNSAWACACGCGIFDVGTSSMYPTSSGGMVYFEYDYQNQSQNRSQNQQASANDNSDKQIATSFFTLGAQYMFNRENGAQIDLPYLSRHFVTLDANGVTNDTFNHSALGDIRVRGIYTGLSEDMSTGFTYGLKLPTGDSTYANYDADTELGSGSTDLLLGIYHLGKITQDGSLDWFGQANFQQPFLAREGYLPGNQVDLALGAYYNNLTFGPENKFVPMFEILGSFRGSDNGALAGTTSANPPTPASGFSRLLISPGFEVDLGRFRVWADVLIPVYQYYVGDQLSAPVAFKSGLAYSF